MLELYNAALVKFCGNILRSAFDKSTEDDIDQQEFTPYYPDKKEDFNPRVIVSPSEGMDFRLAESRFSSAAEDYTNWLPFAAVQLTDPPEHAPRCQPNRPGFSLAKKYTDEGVFIGAPICFVILRYALRFYAASELELYAIVESFFLNFPRPTMTVTLSAWFLEDAPITFSVRLEGSSFNREIDYSSSDQYQVYGCRFDLTLEEVPIIGRPFLGKLLLRPVIAYQIGDNPEDLEVDIAFNP